MQKTSRIRPLNSRNSTKRIFQHPDPRYAYTTGCRLQQMIKTQMTIMMIIRLYLKKTAISAVAATLVNFITIGNPTYEKGGVISRPASPTLQCSTTNPLGRRKHSRFILSNTLVRIMYQTRSLLQGSKLKLLYFSKWLFEEVRSSFRVNKFLAFHL
jgi:hypothetical protein